MNSFELGLKMSDDAEDIGFTLLELFGIQAGMVGVLVTATMLLVRARARRA